MGEVPTPMLLLVDDDMQSRETMRELFERNGCTVIPAATMETAIKSLNVTPNVNMVVTDIKLKPNRNDQSGIILANLIKASKPFLPVAAYSGTTSAADIDPQQYKVFDVYLNKPSNATTTQKFVADCIYHARLNRDVLEAVQTESKISSNSDQELDKLKDELEELRSYLEKGFVRKPSLRAIAGFFLLVLTIAGSAASIVALFT